MTMKKVILDNGHGRETAGKRSPVWADGSQLLEWEFNREIVKGIAKELDAKCIPYHILVPEDWDVPLKERCKRANALYRANKDVYVVSVHGNAGGGTGWEVWTSVGDTPADPLATIFAKEAQHTLSRWRMRFDRIDGDPDKESQFYILKNTKCPALLTENGFMDTASDCAYMMSDEGKRAIIDMHVDAIEKIYFDF